MARQDEDAFINASGTEISRNIARLAERRSDIFGVGAQGGEQTSIGKKLGEEEIPGPPRPDPRHIWDGQQSTIDATTRYAQQQAQRERLAATSTSAVPPPPPNVPLVIGSSQARPVSTLGGNLISSSGPPQQPFDGLAASFSNAAPLNEPPPMGKTFNLLFLITFANLDSSQLVGFDGPASKRARLEDNLEPEELWVQQVRGNITIVIATPIASEWNLEGQTYGINLDVKSTVRTFLYESFNFSNF